MLFDSCEPVLQKVLVTLTVLASVITASVKLRGVVRTGSERCVVV
jgi:hypothetical protein